MLPVSKRNWNVVRNHTWKGKRHLSVLPNPVRKKSIEVLPVAHLRFEANVAKIMGAHLTKGSGNVNLNADMYLGDDILIEHKARTGDRVSIPIKTYLILRNRAMKRVRMPILILSSIDNKYDIAFVEKGYFGDKVGLTVVSFNKIYKTVSIDKELVGYLLLRCKENVAITIIVVSNNVEYVFYAMLLNTLKKILPL